jgi:hypothetical protein
LGPRPARRARGVHRAAHPVAYPRKASPTRFAVIRRTARNARARCAPLAALAVTRA